MHVHIRKNGTCICLDDLRNQYETKFLLDHIFVACVVCSYKLICMYVCLTFRYFNIKFSRKAKIQRQTIARRFVSVSTYVTTCKATYNYRLVFYNHFC